MVQRSVGARIMALLGRHSLDGRCPRRHRPGLGACVALVPDPLAADGDPVLSAYPATVAEFDPPRAAVPAHLYAAPSNASLLTPSDARDLTVALWQLRAQTIAANAHSALGGFETGAALEVDAARGICTCNKTDHFGAATEVTVAVTHMYSFPARFFVGLRTTENDQPWIAMLIVARQSAAQPWRIAFTGGFNPTNDSVTPPGAPTFADGYTLSPTPQLMSVAEQQPANLAGYWQSWKDHGAAPSGTNPSWIPGSLTDQWGREIAQAGTQGQINTGNGMVGYYKFEVQPSTVPLVVAFGANSALVCQPILEQFTWAGRTATRGPYQPPSLTNWGSDVPAGTYRAIITDDVWSPCIQMTQSGTTVSNLVAGIVPFTVADIAIP